MLPPLGAAIEIPDPVVISATYHYSERHDTLVTSTVGPRWSPRNLGEPAKSKVYRPYLGQSLTFNIPSKLSVK
jgi:hypothetical protein